MNECDPMRYLLYLYLKNKTDTTKVNHLNYLQPENSYFQRQNKLSVIQYCDKLAVWFTQK